MNTQSFKRFLPLFAFFIIFAGVARAEGDTVSTWLWQKQYSTKFEKVEYSKTDKYIVARGSEDYIFIDPSDGKEIQRIKKRFKDLQDEGYSVNGCIVFINNDSEFLLESEDRKTINCYSTSDLKVKYSLETPGEEILSFDVSRDEKQIVAKVGKKGIKIWDLESKKITASYTFPTYENELNGMIIEPRFEPSGERILVETYNVIKTGTSTMPPYYTSTSNHIAVVFNRKLDSVSTFPFSFDTKLAFGARWSKSGKYVATLGLKKIVNNGSSIITIIVTVFDTETNKELYSFDAGQSGAMGNFFFTNDEEHIVLAMSSQVDICKVFRIKDGKNTINYQTGSSTGAALDNSGKNIVFVNDNYIFKYSFSNTASIKNEYFDNGIISYPNPIQGGGVLKFNQEKSGNTKIYISDEKGAIVKDVCNNFYDAGQQALSIDASNLANGVYFITVVNDTQNFTSKIIVKR